MQTDWRQQTERSTRVMLRTLVTLAARLPRAGVRLLLYPIVAYFLISSRPARSASRDYLRRALKRPVRMGDLWRHFFMFAACTLDRIFLLSQNASSIRVDATRGAGVADLATSGRGCVLVTAHFGSTEVLRFAPRGSVAGVVAEQASDHVHAPATHIRTTLLMDRRAGQMLTELLEKLNPTLALQIIDAAERGPQLALKLKEAVEAGRMVCLMADRVTANEPFVEVDFLGSRARFAASPWILASALRVPVLLGFGMCLGGNRYAARYELFAAATALPRANRTQAIQALVQQYAARLEHHVYEAPYNWFNFYDYWQDPHDLAHPQ
jgi:predicted LPLAT superfamily acyltransferase